MQKIHQKIQINAPREKVWDTMLNLETYEQWTKPFNPEGSTYKGSWEQGSEIKFIGANEDPSQGESGMYSRIKENRPHEYISIEHVGMIINGQIDTTSDFVKKWVPAFENYSFFEIDGGTEVVVDMDIQEEYKEEFDKMWPEALKILKEICER